LDAKENMKRILLTSMKTKFVHWGNGYFKLKVFYEFEYKDSVYKGEENTPGLYKIYGRKRYREGDKVRIKYPKDKSNKSETTHRIIQKNALQIPAGAEKSEQ